MKVYAVVFDTLDDGFGAEINLFGIYDTKGKAIERISYLRKNKSADMRIPDYGIEEIILNNDCEIYLGGYVE